MRVLLSWLRELTALPPHVDAQAVAARLTMAGLEVEAVERLDEGLDQVVVGEVRSKVPIEGTRLNVCQVFDGKTEHQIVCGAQNYEVGALVPAALPGAVLPGNKPIGAATLRGVDSFGMLCSGKELGVDDGVDGLLLLPEGTAPGTPIAQVLERDDVVLDINVTPNRADALSHHGVARELAALFDLPSVAPPTPRVPVADGNSPATLTVEDGALCPHYAGRVIEGVRVGPSPRWVQLRLEALGLRSINNVVDATNLVMLELGQPMHAFDFDTLGESHIVVRTARPKERLTTLDGVERELSTEDLCICDANGPIALAGVMGGERTEVTETTTSLFLESAFFAPSSVRRAARRHQIHSDASHRFERGVDPERVRLALDRLTELILEVAGGQLSGDVVAQVSTPFVRRTVSLRHRRLEALLGVKVPWQEARRILERLGLETLSATDEALEVQVPGARLDLTREEDLVEEVARVRGLEAIAPRLPSSRGSNAVEPVAATLGRRLRTGLRAAGLDEAINLAFTAPALLEGLSPNTPPLLLRNPLASDLSALRTTLLAGLLRNVSHNLRHGADEVRLYELGRVYLPLADSTGLRLGDAGFVVDAEPTRLAIVLHGRASKSWTGGGQALDFYDLKGAIEMGLVALGVEADRVTTRQASAPFLHPRASAALVSDGGQTLGHLGELHPTLAAQFDLPRGVFVAEFELAPLLALATPVARYSGIPRFPASFRDVALVVDDGVSAASVATEIRSSDTDGLIDRVELFDVYKGAPLPDGKKNLAFSVRYRSAERTLADDDINATHARVVAHLEQAFGARLRS